MGRAYNSSRLYRELKLRGAILEESHLKLLPLEEIVSTIHGVWNLSRYPLLLPVRQNFG
jgi:Bardet-Biedl syndrome 5 protein